MVKKPATAKPAAKVSPAPAVRSAISILDFLASRSEAGLSEIARSTQTNKSTCFNILTELLNGQLVIKDARHATYRLGPKLIEFGTAGRRNFSSRSVYSQALQPIVDGCGFGCVIGQPLGDMSGLVVVDAILPTDPARKVVTPDVGSHYSVTAPAMGRAILAYLGDEAACDVIKSRGLQFPGGRKNFCAELANIRQRGFSLSQEEFKRGINAVSVCILGRHNEVASLACVVGRASEFPLKALMKVGPQLVKAARTIEQASIQRVE